MMSFGTKVPSYHLGQFDTNFIIFKNVEILTKVFFFFFWRKSFFEKENKGSYELFENISFVEIEPSGLINYLTNNLMS
jgi:hypothetical protein